MSKKNLKKRKYFWVTKKKYKEKIFDPQKAATAVRPTRAAYTPAVIMGTRRNPNIPSSVSATRQKNGTFEG